MDGFVAVHSDNCVGSGNTFITTTRQDIRDHDHLKTVVDILGLFTGQQSGHLAYLAYGNSEGDGDYWVDLVKAEQTLPAVAEVGIVQCAATKLSRTIRSEIGYAFSVIELGCGTPQSVYDKTLPVLGCLKKGGVDLGFFNALDIVGSYATNGARLVETSLGIPSNAVVKDFKDSRFSHFELQEGPRIALAWGGTLYNCPTKGGIDQVTIIAEQFRKVASIVGKGGLIIATHYQIDAKAGIDQVLAPYQTTENHDAVRIILERMKDSLQGGIETDAFAVDVRYEDETGLPNVSMGIVATRETKVIFGGFSRVVKEGERFNLVNSFKVSAVDMRRIAERAGLKTITQLNARGGFTAERESNPRPIITVVQVL